MAARPNLDDVLEGEQQVHRGGPLEHLAHRELKERRIDRLQPNTTWRARRRCLCAVVRGTAAVHRLSGARMRNSR